MHVPQCASASASALRVCLLTDVEGNWQYVRNVVRQSSCLRLVPRGAGHGDDSPSCGDGDLELSDDCLLVFGGDAGDKGGHTLRCYEQLVRLKKKHPERVVLLVGNRDVNKMRLTSELHDAEMDLSTMARETYEGPNWVPKDKRVTLSEFLSSQQTPASMSEATPDDAECSRVLLEAANTKVNRLKWMLEHTMGAQGDFERRRTELASHRCADDVEPVNDEAVLTSYQESVQEGGVLREYLLHGSLAFVTHQTLFVHGGIMNGAGEDGTGFSALGYVPDKPSKQFDSVSEWVDKLNAWYRSEVAAWIQQPTWSPDHSSRGGSELLRYVLPDYKGSVVMGRHLLQSGMPAPLPAETARLLSESGIRRVIVGHTPHGNCPTVIKQQGSGRSGEATSNGDDGSAFEDVIMCDTSYSDARAADNRGDAASEVVVEPSGRVHVHGVLEDGHRIAYKVQDDAWVGRMLRDGTMVKARLACDDHTSTRSDRGEDDEYLVFSVKNGYSYSYEYRTVAELLEIGMAE